MDWRRVHAVIGLIIIGMVIRTVIDYQFPPDELKAAICYGEVLP